MLMGSRGSDDERTRRDFISREREERLIKSPPFKNERIASPSAARPIKTRGVQEAEVRLRPPLLLPRLDAEVKNDTN